MCKAPKFLCKAPKFLCKVSKFHPNFCAFVPKYLCTTPKFLCERVGKVARQLTKFDLHSVLKRENHQGPKSQRPWT